MPKKAQTTNPLVEVLSVPAEQDSKSDQFSQCLWKPPVRITVGTSDPASLERFERKFTKLAELVATWESETGRYSLKTAGHNQRDLRSDDMLAKQFFGLAEDGARLAGYQG